MRSPGGPLTPGRMGGGLQSLGAAAGGGGRRRCGRRGAHGRARAQRTHRRTHGSIGNTTNNWGPFRVAVCSEQAACIRGRPGGGAQRDGSEEAEVLTNRNRHRHSGSRFSACARLPCALRTWQAGRCPHGGAGDRRDGCRGRWGTEGPGDHPAHSPSSDVTLMLCGSWGSRRSHRVSVSTEKDPRGLRHRKLLDE